MERDRSSERAIWWSNNSRKVSFLTYDFMVIHSLGGAVQVDSIKTRVESAPGVCNQRLKLKYDEPLSNVAFNFNVRRYTLENAAWLVRSPS
jgi:hypothetical protein